MIEINLKDRTFYLYECSEEKREETRSRLQTLIDLGCSVVGYGEFGIKGVFSGLYIEKVWQSNKHEWDDYLTFIKKLKSDHDTKH